MRAAIEAARAGQGRDRAARRLARGRGRGAFGALLRLRRRSGRDEGASATIFALDTTEQRTLQENLAQSQKMQAIGQLAGGVAHDFNNVLTAIIGYSDLLLANHRPTDPSFQDIMQIKQNANRAAGLVRQLLAFSRRQTLRPQTLQLNDVLSELQMLLRRLVGETIQLDVVHGRDLWLVKADLNQFEQVIVNLVVNARDAMTDGGTDHAAHAQLSRPPNAANLKEVEVVPADYVLVEVQDTGHGIPAEVRAKIFEPFFTTKEVGKGTGLGLSMVYGIVKQTGGYVFCDSEPGAARRSAFCCRGTSPTRSTSRSKKEAAKPAADLTGRGAILLVEDEEAVRAFASRALASRGYTVLEAETGLDALAGGRGRRRADRPHRLRRHHAGNGRADHADGTAQARSDGQDHLRLRLRRRRLRAQPAGGPGIRLPAQAILAQAVDRDRQGRDELTSPSRSQAAGASRRF